MAYDVQRIVKRVRDKMDDSEYSEQLILDFINDTQQEIFNDFELPFNQKTFSGTLAQGQYQFNFVNSATDYQRVVSLRLTSPEKNVTDISENYMNFHDFRKSFPDPSKNTANTPSFWTSYGFVIIFSQPTDQEYVMDMDYVKEATLLEDLSDVPELPPSWQEVLVLGAYIRALERNDDNDIADYHRMKAGGYISQVQTLANRYNPTQRAATTVMRNSRRK